MRSGLAINHQYKKHPNESRADLTPLNFIVTTRVHSNYATSCRTLTTAITGPQPRGQRAFRQHHPKRPTWLRVRCMPRLGTSDLSEAAPGTDAGAKHFVPGARRETQGISKCYRLPISACPQSASWFAATDRVHRQNMQLDSTLGCPTA